MRNLVIQSVFLLVHLRPILTSDGLSHTSQVQPDMRNPKESQILYHEGCVYYILHTVYLIFMYKGICAN